MNSVPESVRTVKTPTLPPEDDDIFWDNDWFFPDPSTLGPSPRDPHDVVYVLDYDPCGRRDDRPVLILPRRDY